MLPHQTPTPQDHSPPTSTQEMEFVNSLSRGACRTTREAEIDPAFSSRFHPHVAEKGFIWVTKRICGYPNPS